MPDAISDLASQLAENAEAVCRHYLPNGKRTGAYWCAGDVHGAPGRSLYVRLLGPSSGKGAAGRWTDAATAEHGDLLDLIRSARSLHGLGETLDEVRRFLGVVGPPRPKSQPTKSGSPDAARRLWAMAKPIGGTLAEAYLRARGVRPVGDDVRALRFHPRCFYRTDERDPDGTPDAWPALLAAVTDRDGEMTGLQHIWLDPTNCGKAPVGTPRRAMGHLLGNAVRFGAVDDVMAAGEGIETVLSLRSVLPSMPMAAALSAGHLAALEPSPRLRHLYIVRDDDQAGQWATERLTRRMHEARIEAIVLAPTLGDFNDDLRELGPDALAANLRGLLAPVDVVRFWRVPERASRIG